MITSIDGEELLNLLTEGLVSFLFEELEVGVGGLLWGGLWVGDEEEVLEVGGGLEVGVADGVGEVVFADVAEGCAVFIHEVVESLVDFFGFCYVFAFAVLVEWHEIVDEI